MLLLPLIHPLLLQLQPLLLMLLLLLVQWMTAPPHQEQQPSSSSSAAGPQHCVEVTGHVPSAPSVTNAHTLRAPPAAQHGRRERPLQLPRKLLLLLEVLLLLLLGVLLLLLRVTVMVSTRKQLVQTRRHQQERVPQAAHPLQQAGGMVAPKGRLQAQ
jgi:hypothetical protein